jgi:hypothetical protein
VPFVRRQAGIGIGLVHGVRKKGLSDSFGLNLPITRQRTLGNVEPLLNVSMRSNPE